VSSARTILVRRDLALTVGRFGRAASVYNDGFFAESPPDP
jgi:hypothetical protein